MSTNKLVAISVRRMLSSHCDRVNKGNKLYRRVKRTQEKTTSSLLSISLRLHTSTNAMEETHHRGQPPTQKEKTSDTPPPRQWRQLRRLTTSNNGDDDDVRIDGYHRERQTWMLLRTIWISEITKQNGAVSLIAQKILSAFSGMGTKCLLYNYIFPNTQSIIPEPNSVILFLLDSNYTIHRKRLVVICSNQLNFRNYNPLVSSFVALVLLFILVKDVRPGHGGSPGSLKVHDTVWKICVYLPHVKT